jgi:hypothetical protein
MLGHTPRRKGVRRVRNGDFWKSELFAKDALTEMGSSQCFYIPCPVAVPSDPGSQSPEQEVVIFFTHHFFLKALSGLSKQGPMFRNSYVTGHLCHGAAT